MNKFDLYLLLLKFGFIAVKIADLYLGVCPLWRSHLAAGRAAGGGCDEIITTSSTPLSVSVLSLLPRPATTRVPSEVWM